MLISRISTAFILVAFVIYLLSFAPEKYYMLLVAVSLSITILLAGTEFIAMRWKDGSVINNLERSRANIKAIHIFMSFAYSIPIFLSYLGMLQWPDDIEKTILISCAWIFLCFFIFMFLLYKIKKNIIDITNLLFALMAGFVYLFLPAILLLKLSSLNFVGLARGSLIYFCLAVVFLGDTGAFFIGINFGKHRLIPKISPKKSIEGAIGGLCVSALAAVICRYFLNLPFSWYFCIIAGIFLGLAGQIGDLFESGIKRASGVKDSGNLLPGHGGVLDRIDSLLFAIPVGYFLFYLWRIL